MNENALSQSGDAVLLRLRIQPRSSRDSIEGLRGDRVRVRVTAPPVEGRANQACLRLLAKVLGKRRSSVSLVAGEKARDKVVRIEDDSVERVREALGL